MKLNPRNNTVNEETRVKDLQLCTCVSFLMCSTSKKIRNKLMDFWDFTAHLFYGQKNTEREREGRDYGRKKGKHMERVGVQPRVVCVNERSKSQSDLSHSIGSYVSSPI